MKIKTLFIFISILIMVAGIGCYFNKIQTCAKVEPDSAFTFERIDNEDIDIFVYLMTDEINQKQYFIVYSLHGGLFITERKDSNILQEEKYDLQQ